MKKEKNLAQGSSTTLEQMQTVGLSLQLPPEYYTTARCCVLNVRTPTSIVDYYVLWTVVNLSQNMMMIYWLSFKPGLNVYTIQLLVQCNY